MGGCAHIVHFNLSVIHDVLYTLSMLRSEKLVYHQLINLAIEKLLKSNPLLPRDVKIGRCVFDDFCIIKICGVRYMIKLQGEYWDRHKFELTSPEANLVVKDCAGVIFMCGKSEPRIPVKLYDYDFILCSSDMIREQIENHLKSVESICCFKFRYQFYNSQILSNGELI